MAATTELSADRPFPGLRPFAYEDRAYFCGREEQSLALFNLLDLSRFVAVVGSSGSGKSSLVHAGLLSLLEQETQEAEARAREEGASGGRRWRWIQFRPGNAPLSRLADQLAELGSSADEGSVERAARRERLDTTLRRTSNGLNDALSLIDAVDGSSLLILVDQFEELFRYDVTGPARARLQEERDQFVQLLLAATGGYDRDIHVMITMRSDFIGDCSQFRGLPEAVSEAQFLVPSLTRLQREEVIRRPLDADHANASIEPALVEQLLNDVGDESDQLPVLQHCLSRLWEIAGPSSPTPPHRHLTRKHYEMVGGVAEALSRHADEILAELAGHEIAVEQVFRALSEEDNDGRATRRALSFTQLRAETGVGDTELRHVVDRFRTDDCSFLVPSLSAQPKLEDETTVDIGHEALLRRWHRVGGGVSDTGDADAEAGWLAAEVNDRRDYRMMLRLISTDPNATLPLNRIDRLLQRWRERPRTEAWANRYGGNLEGVERLFQNTLAAKRRRRRNRVAVAGVVSSLAIGAFAAVFSLYVMQAELTEKQAELTEKQAELTEKARDERHILMNEMTDITQSVATKLRYVPGTNDAIRDMLDEVVNFSEDFAGLLNDHYPDGLHKKDRITGGILSTRAGLLSADYNINFGEIRKAIQSMHKLEADLREIPEGDRQERLDVTLLHGDILLHRAKGEQTYGAFDNASRDYADAEDIYRSIVESSGAQDSTSDAMGRTDLSHAQEGQRRLANLYSSRIFFNLQYRNDANSAADNLDTYKTLVQEQKEADRKSNGGEISSFWAEQDADIARLKASLSTAQGQFDEAIRLYESLLKDSGPGTTASAYLRYKKSLAQLGRGQRDDTSRAIANLKSASRTFQQLAERDPKNMWWRFVRGWIEYALGRAYEAHYDLTNARESYLEAKRINEAFADEDPNNSRPQRELERIERALAQLDSRG